MISKFRAAGSGLSAGAMTKISYDQRYTKVGWGKAALTNCNVERWNVFSKPFREEREVHAIVMIYCPLVEFSYEVIGENFDWPSTSPLSWALDADGLDVGSWE